MRTKYVVNCPAINQTFVVYSMNAAEKVAENYFLMMLAIKADFQTAKITLG